MLEVVVEVVPLDESVMIGAIDVLKSVVGTTLIRVVVPETEVANVVRVAVGTRHLTDPHCSDSRSCSSAVPLTIETREQVCHPPPAHSLCRDISAGSPPLMCQTYQRIVVSPFGAWGGTVISACWNPRQAIGSKSKVTGKKLSSENIKVAKQGMPCGFSMLDALVLLGILMQSPLTTQ